MSKNKIDWDEVKKTIDKPLKDYGVDWKLEDRYDPEGLDNYYECLKDEIIMALKKVM